MHAGIANRWWRGNIPGIPGACATCNFTYLVRGPYRGQQISNLVYRIPDCLLNCSQRQPHEVCIVRGKYLWILHSWHIDDSPAFRGLNSGVFERSWFLLFDINGKISLTLPHLYLSSTDNNAGHLSVTKTIESPTSMGRLLQTSSINAWHTKLQSKKKQKTTTKNNNNKTQKQRYN